MTDRIMDISTIWHQAEMVFPYFHRCGVDWNRAYRKYLDRDLRTTTDLEHALLMAEFINLLGDGHTDLSFKRGIMDQVGYLPFALDYLEGGYWTGGEHVLGFDEKPMEDILHDTFRYVYHVDSYVPRLRYILPLLLGPGEHTLQTRSGSRSFTMMTERPVSPSRQDTKFTLHGDVLRIRFDDLLRDRAPEIREKLREVKPRAVILDIRENIGGMTKFGADIAQLFLSGKFGGCQKWTRTITGVDYASASQIATMTEAELRELMSGEEAREEIQRSLRIAKNTECEQYLDSWGDKSAQAVFSGPVALLTSRRTVSAAEDFTAFFRTNRRASIIGAPTCGTTGTPLLQTLSCGTLRICSVGYKLADGTEFVGKGIQPDILVEPSAGDIRQGKDSVLSRALEWAENRR